MKAQDSDAIGEKSAKVEAITLKGLERRNYFPTMIFQGVMEGSGQLNEDLLKSVYAEFGKDELAKTAAEGEPGRWRSARNLHRNPAFDPLKQKIQAALALVSSDLRYSSDRILKITSMWATINPRGSGGRAECRPGNLWTGCYCVQVPEGAGSLKFVDPRTINIMNPPKYESGSKLRECLTKVDFKPRAGHLVIFPAWLYQEVETNMAQDEGRAGDYVYISFNVIQAKK